MPKSVYFVNKNMATVSHADQFSLRWNNFSSNLTSGFLSHLTENDLVDVTLAVEGQLVRAHKLVLSVCSPYFKSIFKENPCQHPVIILKDMKYEEVESLLKFMYQGEINIKQEDLPTFLKVAQNLQIRGLASQENEQGNVNYGRDGQFGMPSEGRADIASETCRETDTTPGRKRSCESKKRSPKKKKDLTTVSDGTRESPHKDGHGSSTEERQEISLLSNDNSKDSAEDDEIEAASVAVLDQEGAEGERTSSLSDAQNLGTNCTQPAVEPVTYRLSARGRPQLVHEGYVYNLTSRSEGLNRSHYRCAEQHRGCRGKCAVIAERFMPTGVHDHNHPPPGYQSEHDYRKKRGLDVESS